LLVRVEKVLSWFGLGHIGVQNRGIVRKCILSERFDMKANRRLHIGESFIRGIALADDTTSKAERVCDKPIFMLLNDDFVLGRCHGGLRKSYNTIHCMAAAILQQLPPLGGAEPGARVKGVDRPPLVDRVKRINVNRKV
jgi:hypothetical protein